MEVNIDSIKEGIAEDAEERVDGFLCNNCFLGNGIFVTKQEFKKELCKAVGWVSNKILNSYMRARGVKSGRLYVRGRQSLCWLGVKIGIKS